MPKIKIYKPFAFVMAFLITVMPCLAQDTTGVAGTSRAPGSNNESASKGIKFLSLQLGIDSRDVKMAVNKLNESLNQGISELNSNLRDIVPQVKDIVQNISISYDDSKVGVQTWDKPVNVKVKNYSKTYTVDADDEIFIDNKYGDITVNTWDRNEVKVDVEIKSYADDDQSAQKMIDAISISDIKTGNQVLFATNFGNGVKNFKWNLFGKQDDHHKTVVNYTVYMPSRNGLNISNHFGNIKLPNLSGKVAINSSYGSLSAQKLSGASNTFNFHNYEVSIEELSAGWINLSYGSLKLGTVGKLEANINSAPIDIDKILWSGSFNVRYGGGVKIGELGKSLKNLAINATYSSVNINLRGDENFDFDVTVKYNNFKYDENKVKLTSKSPDEERGYRATKSYKGYVGNSGSNALVVINCSYESVKLE